MARKAYGKHATQVDINQYPDDGSSPVGSNEWNEEPDNSGMLGFSPANATRTISSGVVSTTDTINVIVSESGTSDTLDKLSTSDTSEYDLAYLFAQTGHTITLTNTGSLSASGQIQTVSGIDETLSETSPTILIRKGNYWYGYGGGVVNNVADIQNVTITNNTSGELLKWSGTAWVNNTLSEAGISATGHNHVAAHTTDFDVEVANNTAVALNTAKITYPSSDSTKLAGIEAGATADQTNSEIKTAYEANADTNEFSDAEQTKLAAIESSSTADQTGAEIKTLYEAEANAFTDSQFTKLAGIETAATADQTNAEIKAAVEAATDSNTFTDADHSKLNAIEASATADQTASEIKTLYESNNDTNEFSDAEQTKLLNIETSATADQTGAEIKSLYEVESSAFTDAQFTKLAAIEALADVTDATNVASSGAVMEADTTTALMGFVIDEDAMGTDSATKIPTQQSVKAYVDTTVANGMSSDITLQGDYNASTNSPDLDTSPSGISKGDHYVVSTSGTFFTEALQSGDSLIAKQDNPTTLAHWILTNNNLTTPITNNEISATANIALSKLAVDPLARANHTGTQTAATISDFDTEVGNHPDVVANSAKSTNATHTGDVTGATALTIGALKVTNAMLAGSIALSKLATDPLARANHTGTQAFSTITGTVPETQGGTNQTTFATGDIMYASGANTLTKLTAGTDGDQLQLASGIPSWVTPSGADPSDDINYSGLYDIEDIQRVCFEIQSSAFASDGTNNANRTGESQVYVRNIDSNNDGIFIKMKKAGSVVEVQIA